MEPDELRLVAWLMMGLGVGMICEDSLVQYGFVPLFTPVVALLLVLVGGLILKELQ